MLARRLGGLLLRVNGYPQEFLCLEVNALAGRFVWKLDDAEVDPTRILFFGYRPLILGLDHPGSPTPQFLQLDLDGTAIARIKLVPLKGHKQLSGIHLFGGRDPWQRFLPPWIAPLDRLRQWLNARRSSNVPLARGEYDMLRIAYAQPREIHLAVVGGPERCNIFPTDLHGPVGNDDYIISLRHANAACAQVMVQRDLLLCRMNLDRYRVVYGLARRHGADVDQATRITSINGSLAGHALPEGALSVMQLELRDHADHGIHRLLRFSVKERIHVKDGPVLAHAHAGPLGLLKRRGPAPVVLTR